MTCSVGRRIAFLALLPLWLLLTCVVNALEALADGLDRTGLFYDNLLVAARKRQQPRPVPSRTATSSP